MHRDRLRLSPQSLGSSALPFQPIIEREVNPWRPHAAVRLRIHHVNRVRTVARRHRVKVRLALQSELLPGLSLVGALYQPERINQSRPRSGMAAAVER